jgi:hypothetical protein
MKRMKQIPLDIPTSGTHRGAITDGSRGFQPTVTVGEYSSRRGATVDVVASRGMAHGLKRRDATRFILRSTVRGLKPTATVMRSRRDEEAVSGRGATIDGSRAFQRPDRCPVDVLRRVATLDVSGLPIKSRN